MISKDLFKTIIVLIEEQDAIDEKVSKALELVTDSWVLFNTNNKRYEALRILLKEVMNDKNDWISYWLYELDYGKKAKEGTVTDKDGKNIPIKTMDDLYAAIVNEN